jgi:hypothetical protein
MEIDFNKLSEQLTAAIIKESEKYTGLHEKIVNEVVNEAIMQQRGIFSELCEKILTTYTSECRKVFKQTVSDIVLEYATKDQAGPSA